MSDRLIDGTPKRKYGRRPREDAATIAAEVILTGRSRGWCGDSEEQERTALVLAPYGIVYTDDLWGEWTHPGDPR